jgi:hypothetical protein
MNDNKENFSNSPQENQDYLAGIRPLFERFFEKTSGKFEYQSFFYMAGVFEVVCVPKNSAYFSDSYQLMIDISMVVKKLEEGVFENKELVEDFKLFGFENFRFEIVVSGEEYFDDQKRKAALDSAKKSWPGSLY